MTRDADRRDADRRLDALLDGAPVPGVPEDLAKRIVAEVTSLPQEQPRPDAAPAEDVAGPKGSRLRKRRIAACAAAVAAIVGVAALSLASEAPPSQPQLIASAPRSEAATLAVAEPADLSRTAGGERQDERRQVEEKAVPPFLLASPVEGEAGSGAAPVLLQPPPGPEAAMLAAPEVEAVTRPAEVKAEEALASVTAPAQGPEIEAGSRGSASIYGPPVSEGMGIVGGSLPRSSHPMGSGGGASPLPPPPPSR